MSVDPTPAPGDILPVRSPIREALRAMRERAAEERAAEARARDTLADLVARLAALEARVAALERANPPTPPVERRSTGP
jgi:hypothetical protein